MPAWLAPAIGAVAGFIGNRQNNRNIQASNAQLQRNNKWQQDFAEKQFNQQQQNYNEQMLRDKNWRESDWKRQQYMAKHSAGWQFDDLMEAADEAGIHRLSAIGGASAASYQPTGSSGPSTSPIGTPGLEAPQPEQSMIGDAVGDAISMIMRQEEFKHQKAMDKADLEIRQREADLLAAQSRTYIAKARQLAGEQTQPGATGPEADPQQPTFQLGGKGWNADPDTMNAEDFEMRYGGVIGDIAGVAIAKQDLSHALEEASGSTNPVKQAQWLVGKVGGPKAREIIATGDADLARDPEKYVAKQGSSKGRLQFRSK